MEIIIIDEFNSLNNGEMARVMSSVEIIRKFIYDANFTLLSSSPDIDKERYKFMNIKVMKRPWYRSTGSISESLVLSGLSAIIAILTCVYGRFTKRGEFYRYDIFIHLLGDVFNDYGLIPLFYHLFHASIGMIVGKPVIIYAESFGPFRNELLKFITKIVLNRASLILVREKISENYLMNMGVTKSKVYLTTDPAFVLMPALDERIDAILSEEGINWNARPLIGISAVEGIRPDIFPTIIGKDKKYKTYVEFMSSIADYLIQKYNANIILVPHVLRHDDDDRIINKNIFEKCKRKENIKLLSGLYTADELKGIISRFDIFIGSRMHATIASTSSLVPTIALAHSHKFIGIIGGILDQKEFIIDLRYSSPDELLLYTISKIDLIFSNREKIKIDLQDKIKNTQSTAILNGKILKEVLESLA